MSDHDELKMQQRAEVYSLSIETFPQLPSLFH
jgi:hypothetical protein